MKNTPHRKFRLLVTITVLFTALIVTFGLIFRQIVYWNTSKMLLENSKLYFSQIKNELTLDYLKTRKTVSQSIHILGESGIITAENIEERVKFLPAFSVALKEEPNMSAIQVGYGTGDFFIVRPINNKEMREQFEAPPGASYILDNISVFPDNKRYLERLWFDGALKEIGRNKPEETSYDPRTRPWFKAALEKSGSVGTDPYLFHFIRQMGLTISFRPPGASSVIAGDVTLYHLSRTLEKYHETPRSEVVLLEKRGQEYLVAAYKDPAKLIIEKGEIPARSRARDLGVPVIRFAASQPGVMGSYWEITYQNEKWIGSTQQLELPGRDNFLLATMAPENEVLQDAKALQARALHVTFAMILLSIPLTWFLARRISNPINLLADDARKISRFEFGQKEKRHTFISEVDQLDDAMMKMESTISQFISLINSLSSEQDFDKLLWRGTEETMAISEADAGFTYIVSETKNTLRPVTLREKHSGNLQPELLPVFALDESVELVRVLNEGKSQIRPFSEILPGAGFTEPFSAESSQVVLIPLRNRQQENIGILCLLYDRKRQIDSEDQRGRLAFIEALSGFAAVTIESRKMLQMQKDLLESFIKLIAGAIDSKSPYTGGHCQRVPVLTKLLAKKACEASDGPFADYDLNSEEWEAIHIASWLHDCGKVTTPEYVVDKATKLETIYDRIHEVRMRFEVLKRDAQIGYWKQLTEGGDQEKLKKQLNTELRTLDEEYAFVADCNLGSEFMGPEKIDRLREIAERTWHRTLDDRIGISWEELKRKQRLPEKSLPVEEKLLEDRYDHLFTRSDKDSISSENDYGFKLNVPEYLYNKGEVYNLSITRGTLSAEDRYKINDHIVQTIIMLNKLPYPKHLTDVPNIAGGHHEKIDGTGYPRRLDGKEMSTPAKMMVIADIFEALTASDRPYKKAKTLSESIKIMGFMEKDKHIDSELFHLFLTSGVYLEYGREYLLPDQIDDVDITQYTSKE